MATIKLPNSDQFDTMNGHLANIVSTATDAIGNRTYSENNFVTDGETVTSSINALDLAMGDIFNLVYPVGTLYMTDDAAFNPATAWGGTWSRIQGRMIVGASDTDADFDVGDEGGAKTSSALIAHTHPLTLTANATAFGAYKDAPTMPTNTGTNWGATTGSAGSGASFSLMNPYHASFIWKRTA